MSDESGGEEYGDDDILEAEADEGDGEPEGPPPPPPKPPLTPTQKLLQNKTLLAVAGSASALVILGVLIAAFSGGRGHAQSAAPYRAPRRTTNLTAPSDPEPPKKKTKVRTPRKPPDEPKKRADKKRTDKSEKKDKGDKKTGDKKKTKKEHDKEKEKKEGEEGTNAETSVP